MTDQPPVLIIVEREKCGRYIAICFAFRSAIQVLHRLCRTNMDKPVEGFLLIDVSLTWVLEQFRVEKNVMF